LIVFANRVDLSRPKHEEIMRQTIRMHVAVAIAFVLIPGSVAWAQHKSVSILKTPHGGIQPQAIADTKGVVHLLYFKGDPKAGDLFYSRREPGKTEFSAPLKVNSQHGSAIAMGTIRGGQLSIGTRGRVHVAWNGSGKALRKAPGNGVPMLYARLNDAGTAFEEQRNLMTQTDVLDGGGTVAADQSGNVYVAWHALKIDSTKGEDSRKVWVAQSADEGKTFAGELAIYAKPTGACGCCGMKGFVDSKGVAYFIYRAATQDVHRDMYLLASVDAGKSYQGNLLHKWEINHCPMSSEAFAEGLGGLYTAWDTDGQVYFARIKSGSAASEEPVTAPGHGKGRKHPALAVNNKGEVILVWTEGTGWQRGGALAWQVYDKSGRPMANHGRIANAIPVWGLPAVIAESDERFTIIH
jgi:hypothetical protein